MSKREATSVFRIFLLTGIAMMGYAMVCPFGWRDTPPKLDVLLVIGALLFVAVTPSVFDWHKENGLGDGDIKS